MSILRDVVRLTGLGKDFTRLPVILASDDAPASIVAAVGSVGSVRIKCGERPDGRILEFYGFTGFAATVTGGTLPNIQTNRLNWTLQVYDETENTQWFSKPVWAPIIIPINAESTTQTAVEKMFMFPKPIIVEGAHSWLFELTNRDGTNALNVYQFCLHGYEYVHI